MRHSTKTRPFRDAAGAAIPGSIAEAGYLELGGIEQWVMIRGENLDNPVLVQLHGGPGFSDTPFLRRCNADLEKAFTMVYWEQRGTGKSFDRRIPRTSMTVEQFISDLDELVHAVCARTGRSDVALFGHSWGSVLGVLYAARFPHRVSVYVGSGQYGSWPASESASYAYAVRQAAACGDRKALEELTRIGPPPHHVDDMFRERTLLQRIEGQLGVRGLWRMSRDVLGAPESSVFDLPAIMRGWRFSLDAMWAEVSKANLLESAPTLQMPVLFFLGRHDHWVPPETSVAYYEALTAPSKTLVWFEESGHEPFADEPGKFNRLMVELVRPVAAHGLVTAS